MISLLTHCVPGFILAYSAPHPLTVDDRWVGVSVPTDGEDVSEVYLLKVDAST